MNPWDTEGLASVRSIMVKTENMMDRQRIEGGLKKATGSIKDQAGKAVGDRHLEGEGKAEKAEGHIRSGVGKAMDAIRDVVEKE